MSKSAPAHPTDARTPPTESTMTTQDTPSSLGPATAVDSAPIPPDAPAPTAPPAMGRLADETPDVMTLHTQDAFRMFIGRAADAATKAPAIPGGRRFAAIMPNLNKSCGIW